MGKDASLQFEPLENHNIGSGFSAKEHVIGTVGIVAHDVKEQANIAIEVVKEKAHDAAETIKWQAEEVREGLHRRLSVDDSVIVAHELSPIPEEPPTPLKNMTLTATAEVASAATSSKEFIRTTDLPHEKIAVIPMETLQVEDSKPAPLSFYDKLFATQRTWEETAHNARLRIDATLEKQFGGQADKIHVEMERVRVGAIQKAAQFAELLQAKFRRAASQIEEREPAPAVEGAPVIKQPLDVIPHNLGHGSDLENSIAEKGTTSSDSTRERSISESARVARLFQGQFEKAASTLREQQQHGAVPVYR